MPSISPTATTVNPIQLCAYSEQGIEKHSGSLCSTPLNSFIFSPSHERSPVFRLTGSCLNCTGSYDSYVEPPTNVWGEA